MKADPKKALHGAAPEEARSSSATGPPGSPSVLSGCASRLQVIRRREIALSRTFSRATLLGPYTMGSFERGRARAALCPREWAWSDDAPTVWARVPSFALDHAADGCERNARPHGSPTDLDRRDPRNSARRRAKNPEAAKVLARFSKAR